MAAGLLPDVAALAAFAGAVAVLNATPGVDLLLTMTRTLAAGRRAGAAAALGINAGCVVHAAAATAGLAGLLALHPLAFRVLQWAGAAYLAWLGLGMLRQALRGGGAGPADARAGDEARSPGWAAEFRRGLLTNLLNPKVALFFVAFLPPFVPAASPHPAASVALLGAWFVAQSTLFLLGVVAVSAPLARWQTPRRVRCALTALGGTLFVALAWRLAVARPAGP